MCKHNVLVNKKNEESRISIASFLAEFNIFLQEKPKYFFLFPHINTAEKEGVPIERVMKKEILKKASTTLVLAEISFPVGICESIDGFYREAAEVFLKTCREKVYRLAEEAYERSEDKRKKYRFPPYRAECRFEAETRDKGILIMGDLTLSDSSGQALTEKKIPILWKTVRFL